MFTSMTAKVSTNTYCLARTRRFSRWSENFVGRVTHECEAPTDAGQLKPFNNQNIETFVVRDPCMFACIYSKKQ